MLIKKLIKKVPGIDIVLDFLYPPRCVVCNEIIEKIEIKTGFCKCCRSIIRLTPQDICLKCGRPLGDSTKEFCGDCMDSHREFYSARAVYEYTGSIKPAMYRFKYGNARFAGRVYARDALDNHRDWLEVIKPRLLVPVPVYPHKKRVRGYNQAEVFAGYLSDLTGIPMNRDLCIRVVDTKPLKTLSPAERRQNLKDVFINTKVFRNKADVLIIDDIFTTGATVEELAKLLKEAGAGRVYCLFICTGRKD